MVKGTKLQQHKSSPAPLHRRSHVLRRLANLNCSPLCEFSDGGAVTTTAANVSNNQRGWFAICKRLAALYTICATSSVLTGHLMLAIRRLFVFTEGLRRRRPALIHSAGGCALTMYALVQSSNFEICFLFSRCYLCRAWGLETLFFGWCYLKAGCYFGACLLSIIFACFFGHLIVKDTI